jgi:hypothetical protein
LPQSPSAAVGSMILPLSNELGEVPTNTTALVNGLQAMVVWLALPASAKQTILAGQITKTGSWSSADSFGQVGNANFSNSVGATASATVTGTTVYLAGYVAGGYGTGTVTIDGVSKGSVSFLGSVLSGTVYPVAFRFSGLSSGSHTVVLTVASGYANIMWVAGNGSGPQTPLVGIGATIPRNTYPTQPGILNTAVQSMVANLQADGLNVIWADDNTPMSLTALPAEYSADNIHPNQYGDSIIARAWYEAFVAPAADGQFLAQVLNNTGYTAAQLSSLLKAVANLLGITSLKAGTCAMSSSTTCTVSGSYPTSPPPTCVATVQGSTAIAGACTVTNSTTITVTAASSNSQTWGVALQAR